MRINYEIPDEIVAAWRKHVLEVKGSQRGGAAIMAEAMRAYLVSKGALVAILLMIGMVGAMPEPYYQDVPVVLEDPDTIAAMLTEFNYSSLYVEDVFDCSEIAGHAEWLLENRGIESRFMISNELDHMFIACNTSEGWIAFETCYDDGAVVPIRDKTDFHYNSSTLENVGEIHAIMGDYSPVDWWSEHPELES